MVMTIEQQRGLIRRVERDTEQALKRAGQWRGSLAGQCITLAVFAALRIRAAGSAATLRAGTCMWPLLRGGMDPGPGKTTHCGYQWSPTEEPSKQARAMGLLPEVHVWVETPERETVDLTTGFLPKQAARHGYSFSADAVPPDHFWSKEIPPGVVYRPEPDALGCALESALTSFKDEEIVAELSGGPISKRIKKILRNARRAGGGTTVRGNERSPIRREELGAIIGCPPVLMLLGRLIRLGRPCAVFVAMPEDRTASILGPESMSVLMPNAFVVIDSRQGIAQLVARAGAVSNVHEIADAPEGVIPMVWSQSGRMDFAYAPIGYVRGLLNLHS